MKTARTLAFSVRLRSRLSSWNPLFGAAVLAATGATMVACADESDPNTWVKRLSDPLQRPNAVKQLDAMFEAKLTAAKSKVGNIDAGTGKPVTEYDAPEVTALLDVIVGPLTSLYAAGGLDDVLRKDLIQYLADFRDPRTGPAFAKALGDYAQGKPDDDVRIVCVAIVNISKAGKTLDAPVLDALWNVFANYHLSKATSQRFTQGLHEAVREIGGKNQSYGDKAITMLGNAVPAQAADNSNNDEINDALMWWQQTSIQVISDLHYAPAVKTLVTVLLTKEKVGLNPVTKTALAKMAKDAEPVLIAALNGTDPDLKKLGDAYKDGDKLANLAVAADTLGFLSRPAGRDAVLAQLANDAAQNDTTRGWFAQSLVQFPSTPAVEPAFLAAYAKLTPASASAPSLGGAKLQPMLIQATSSLYDPSMVDFLVKASLAGTDSSSKLIPIDPAMKLMTSDKKKSVGDALDKVEADVKKLPDGAKIVDQMRAIFNTAGKVMDDCKQDPMCYVKVLGEDIPSAPPTANQRQIKACYMAVIYAGKNGDAVRAAMVAQLDKVRDQVARFALVSAVDELAPNGDAATADLFEKTANKDLGLGDDTLTKADNAVVQVALRLRARSM